MTTQAYLYEQDDALKVPAESAPLYWTYLPEWCAWWLMVDDGTSSRGYGPFNATEAEWAGKEHGVPFTGAPA